MARYAASAAKLPLKQRDLLYIIPSQNVVPAWEIDNLPPIISQYLAGQVSSFSFLSICYSKQVPIFLTMRSQKNVSRNPLFASALLSILLGSIASPLIGGGEQSWVTLGEPEFLAYDAADSANLPNPPSTPDTGADWTSWTALLNNAQLGNTAAEVLEPQQQENNPYLISDGMVGGTSSSSKSRGPPTPLRSDLQEWDFRKYPGYPSDDGPALYDPKTGIYWAQKRLSCSRGKKLFCCRPDDIKCCTCECQFYFTFSFGRKTAFKKWEGENRHPLLVAQTWELDGFCF